MSYAERARLAHRFAQVLRTLGLGKGDHVFVLTPRIIELYAAVLGALLGWRLIRKFRQK